MSLGNERQKWQPMDLADEVKNLIRQEETGPDWSGALSETPEGGTRKSDIDKILPTRVNALAAAIVNNRVANPVGAIAYGKEDGIDYEPERPGETLYDRTLIANILNAKSYGDYLLTRLFWTIAITGISTAIFYALVWFGGTRGWNGGLLALGTSALFVLGWLLLRIVREQTNSRSGGFFRHRGSLLPIQAVATATAFLDDKLQDFVDEVLGFQADCITRSDQLPRDEAGEKGPAAYFCENANAMAQSMVTWAIARRGAQYLWFQPINVQDKYEMNGVSKARVAAWDTSFSTFIWLLIAFFVGLAIFLPLIFVRLRPEMMDALWAVEQSGTFIYVWPLAHAVFAAAIALWLSGNDKRSYKQDRNRVTLALDDFWRRGTVRTADEISALRVKSSATYTDWFPLAAREMIRYETDPRAANFAKEASEKYEAWDKGRKWNDDLVLTDPTPQLMRRYLKFLDTVGSRSVVHNRGRSSFAKSPPLPAGIEADARPRTRALATLTRREIWHP